MTDAPSPDRRAQIIDAAFRAFSRKGFKGTTNKEIAREAGVTPGLIYWYFRDKEDLFEAVIDAKTAILPLHRLAEELRETPPREYLPRVASLLAATFEQDALTAGFRFMLAEAMRSKHVRGVLRTRLIGRILRDLSTYFAHQKALGTFREIDPELAARHFLGMMIAQVIMGRLLEYPPPVSLEENLRAAVETFLQGVEA